jgi:hypothetical protein
MSHDTLKAVSTIIFTAAALGIGYRIATSPERGSRTKTPNARMAPKDRPKKSALKAQDSQPVVEPRRSRRLAGGTDAEDSEPTFELRRGGRRNADSKPEDSKPTIEPRTSRRRSADLEEPEDAGPAIGAPRNRRRSVAPDLENAKPATIPRSRSRVRDESPDGDVSPYVARHASASGPYVRDFSDKFLRIIRGQPIEGDEPQPRPDRRRLAATTRPKPGEKRRPNSRNSVSHVP